MIKPTFNKFSNNKFCIHSKLTTCQVPDWLCRRAVHRYLSEIRYFETIEVICNTGHDLPEIFYITIHNLYLYPLVCTTRLDSCVQNVFPHTWVQPSNKDKMVVGLKYRTCRTLSVKPCLKSICL